MEKEHPYGDLYKNYYSHYFTEDYTSDYVYPVDDCSYVYIDSQYITGETMTVPANTIVLDSAEEYKTNNDDYSNFHLETYENDNEKSSVALDSVFFCDYAGKKESFSIPEGDYKWFLGGYAGGVHATSYSDPQEYIQVKLNMKDMFSSLTENCEFTFDSKAGTLKCPTIGNKNTGANVSFGFLSGSVVTAAIPDSDGNVCIWINANDQILQFQNSFNVTYTVDGVAYNSVGGGVGVSNMSCPRTQMKIDAEFKIPESGLTLYDIPAGDYTVEADSTEYTLENNTIKVTDTKDIQIADVVLKKAERPSSSETSSEVSSSEVSSSEAGSSEASSSDVTSSDTGSSDTASSVIDSKTASSDSSGSKAASKASTTNPSTGAAAGLTGIALIAGAAVVVSKKSRK